MKIEICNTNKNYIIYTQIHKDIIKHNINMKDEIEKFLFLKFLLDFYLFDLISFFRFTLLYYFCFALLLIMAVSRNKFKSLTISRHLTAQS